jgi:ATP-binding protein involved in chromosome partitioning
LKTKWSKKVLFIDMPPGTSDAVLSIFNLINDIVIVTEPTEVAVSDAIRTIALARKYNKNIIGIIENRSGEIFGSGVAREIAEKYNLKFLGEVPLDKRFIEATKIGKPAALIYDDIKELFSEISRRMGL